MSRELERVKSDLQQMNIILVVQSNCIKVNGSPKGIKHADSEINKLVTKIYKTTHSIYKPGLKALVKSSEGKAQLDEVNKQAGVVVGVVREDTKPVFCQRVPYDIDRIVTFEAPGEHNIIVVKGDITSLEVDVIAHALNKTMDIDLDWQKR